MNRNKEKIVCFILAIFCILSLISFIGVYDVEASSWGNINNFGSGTALEASKSAFGTAVCSCAPTYAYIDEQESTSGANKGQIIGNVITLDKTSASSGNKCVYSNGSKSITVYCNSSTGTSYLKKYMNAGIFGTGTTSEIESRANKFYNDAYVYASSVQMGLSSKTQAGNGWSIDGWSDLGNGRFQKAMFDFNNNAHYVYSFMIGFAFITAMLVFILIFMKITWLPDHPIKRREAMEDIVTSGVSVILTGGIWIIISLFQSIFDRFWSSYAVYSKDWKTVANMFLYEYKGLVVGILGVAALTALLMFIKNFVGLSFSGDNPNARKQKMISILFCGIATAGLGALTIVVGFFWNVL